MQAKVKGACAIEGNTKVQSGLFMQIHLKTECGPRAYDGDDILKHASGG